jgi:hypothetical protein
MRNVLFFTTLFFACTTGYLWIALRSEKTRHALAKTEAKALQTVNKVYGQAFAEVKSTDAMFVAIADSLTTSSRRMSRWWRKQPAPAAPAVRFDTVYIPTYIPTPQAQAEMLTDVVLPDTNACAEYVNRAIARMRDLYEVPRPFVYSSATGNLHLRGQVTRTGALRIDTLAVPTRLLLHEKTVRARGLAGLAYRERELRVEAMNPLVVITPREAYVTREPNKLLRALRVTGIFLAGSATGYFANQFSH